MNNQNNSCNSCNCISEILKVILILQQGAEHTDNCLDTCDRGFLGQQCCPTYCNTRPIQLYSCCNNGNPISMPVSKSPTETSTSSIFRLEKLDDCCATCRVLTVNTEDNLTTYNATNSFFTINLNCVCMIRCLDDAFVENV